MHPVRRVLNKKQNYDLWQSGAYGNKLRAWRTIEAWRDSGFDERVVLRYLDSVGGGSCTYHLKPEDVDDEVQRWLDRGLQLDRMMLNEMADGALTSIQGEYLAGVLLNAVNPFFFSLVKKPMREALAASSTHAYGLRARLLLEHYMTPSSYSDFVELLEQYPDHVFEVSVFDRCLGDLPQRNAVVWEVRLY